METDVSIRPITSFSNEPISQTQTHIAVVPDNHTPIEPRQRRAGFVRNIIRSNFAFFVAHVRRKEGSDDVVGIFFTEVVVELSK